MIIVRLQGGLGNQMFQYAAGRSLALRRGVKLKLDLSATERPTDRGYSLAPFPIRATAARPGEQLRLLRGTLPARAARRLLGRRPPERHIREQNARFDPEILDLPDKAYLDGYWQSERYFADIAELIRSELAPPAPVSRPDRELADQMRETEAVSVHVRRGDYVSSKVAREILGPCDMDYYRRAIGFLATRLEAPHLFVFSDEPEWVREHLDLRLPTTLVDHNGPGDAHRDMALMAGARHHVIANSSFSWWSAWLAPGPEKIVIAPRRWFAREDLSSEDLVPERWVRL